MRQLNRQTLLCLALILNGCVSVSVGDKRAAATAAAVPEVPSGLHWFLTSAERRALYEQTYQIAGDRILARAAGRAPGSWAVIADADETLLDNAQYQLQLARSHAKYDEASWQAWVRTQQAVALPGARAFVDRVLAAGGAVVVVTNRLEPICDETRANLVKQNLRVAGVLCAPIDPATGKSLSDKNPRFTAVRKGTTGLELPPLDVLGYVGDNIKDFPQRSQQHVEPLAEFGESLFLLPNPMYGSWETNPLP